MTDGRSGRSPNDIEAPKAVAVLRLRSLQRVENEANTRGANERPKSVKAKQDNPEVAKLLVYIRISVNNSATSMATYLGVEAPDIVLRSVFRKYDVDNSGFLAHSEVRRLLGEDLAMHKEEIEAFSLLLDKDASHKVSYDEFKAWMQSPNRAGLARDPTGSKYHILLKAVEYFKQYDTDQSGALEGSEFEKLMKSMGVRDEAVAGALNGLDRDHNGKISFEEFLKWLNWIPMDDL